MKIEANTTIVDLAFNLTGSLAGIPALLSQLPVGVRIGFDDLPALGEDVSDVGQTWTPDLEGLNIDFKVPIYNAPAQLKAPYSTNIFYLSTAIEYGEAKIAELQNLGVL